jgi:hypothetical protein
MKKQVGFGLVLLVMSVDLAFAQGSLDRASDRLDAARARNESRYNAVGNQPQTQTIVKEKVITVPVTSSTSDSAKGLVAKGASKPKTKRVVIQETVTVTKPAPMRINPY